MRLIFSLILLVGFKHGYSQNVESFGVFGGFNVPVTFDEGLNKDPRYEGKVTFRATPVGFTYGYDRVGFGFVLTPSLTKIGQKFLVKNTVGGDVGIRDVQMDYFNLPVALKLHLNDLSFFRLSAVAALNFTYLLNGRETISYSASKQTYPSSVLIPSEPGYTKVFDGVLVPEVNGLEYVSKNQYNPFQLFAAVGLRSDFDLSDEWSINFDGRANFGLFDPRKKDYIEQLQQTSNAPGLYGVRHEIYLSAEIGIARIFQIKEKFASKNSGKPIVTHRPSAPKHNNKKILTKKKKKKN